MFKNLDRKYKIIALGMILTFSALPLLLTNEQPTFVPNYILSDIQEAKHSSTLINDSLQYKSSDLPKNFTWGTTWGEDLGAQGYGISLDNQDMIYTVGTVRYHKNDELEQHLILMKWNKTGDLLWNRTWGGESYNAGVAVDNNNGSVYTVAAINNSLLLTKWDTEGNPLWNRSLWGPFGDVVTDDNGSIYMSGIAHTNEALYDLLLVKWDANGNQLWNSTWNGSGMDYPEDVVVDANGDIYIVGHTSFSVGSEDLLLVKWDADGNQLWNRTWGGSKEDIGFGIGVATDGSVYTTGSTTSFGEEWQGYSLRNLLLIKWNNLGQQLWNRTWAGSNVGQDVAVASEDGSIFTVGGITFRALHESLQSQRKMGPWPNYDLLLAKWNPNGTLVGVKTWGLKEEAANRYPSEEGHGVAVGSDGKLYCVGTRGGAHLPYSLILAMSSPDGFRSVPLLIYTSNEIDFGLESPFLLLMFVLTAIYAKRRKIAKKTEKQ